MTKIQVPENAVSLLDEIIKLAKQVETTEEYLWRFPSNFGIDEGKKYTQDFENLMSHIDTLGHYWCGMDPLIYFCTLAEDSSKSTNLWFIVENEERPRELFEFRVPSEIYQILKNVQDNEHIDSRYLFLSSTRQLLFELRRKIVIRVNLETLSTDSQKECTIYIGEDFRLSSNNRTAYMHDKEYILNEKEGTVIRHLYEKLQEGFPNVEKQTLIDIGCGKQSNVTDVRNIFSDRETYRALVKNVGKGLYRLNI